MNKNNIEILNKSMDLYSVDEIGNPYCSNIVIKLMNKCNDDFYSSKIKFTVNLSIVDVVDTVKKYFNIPVKTMIHNAHIASIETDGIFIVIRENDDNRNFKHNNIWKAYHRNLTIDLFGIAEIKNILEYIEGNLQESTIPTITWEFFSDGSRTSENVKIAPAQKIYREFYPWIDREINVYYDDYLKSESSILVLLGPPGTAKTSFIRNMIWHGGLNTVFTYEEALLNSDSFFVDFIMNDKQDILVVEDADLLLTSRENDGNKVMSKFLNIGDGLANIGYKKMIFTANLTDSASIDDALLRPGRCFDCMEFRKLTYDEACAAANVAELPKPSHNKSYSIAELFAESKGEPQQRKSGRRIGFGA